jgi:pimeloyl-ACP methyl ester carboxylesterase
MSVLPEHRGGDGVPLLLLHGITATHRVWEPVLEELERHHLVIAPTLAGHAGALPLERGVAATVNSLADRIEQRLDELQIVRPHIAGNSLGGWIALELARRGRARSVIAFSPPAAWASARDLARVSLLVSAGHLGARASGPRMRALLARPRARQRMLALAFEHPERIPPDVVCTMLDENSECAVVGEFVRSVWRDGPISGGLATLDCPIRIAWPVRDRTTPFERHCRPLLAALPEAELVMLSGVGHVPMYDDPALVARTILELTSAVDSDRDALEPPPAAGDG